MATQVQTEMSISHSFLYPCKKFVAGAVRALLKDFGRDIGFDPYDAQVCAGELIANAVMHTPVDDAETHDRIVIELGFDEERNVLSVGVRDWIDRLPVLCAPNFFEETGRGLNLVDALSERWGVVPLDDGKIVWCELRMRPAAGHELPTRYVVPSQREYDLLTRRKFIDDLKRIVETLTNLD